MWKMDIKSDLFESWKDMENHFQCSVCTDCVVWIDIGGIELWVSKWFTKRQSLNEQNQGALMNGS